MKSDLRSGLGPCLRAVALLTVLVLLPLRVALADLFVVPGVIVSVAANSSVEAKSLAETMAKEQAFRRLAERLVVPEDQAAIPAVTVAQIEPTIAAIRVLDEVATGTTFDGRFTIRFEPAATRRLLQDLGLRYTEVQSRPYVIVPVYQSEGGTELWEGVNPWLSAWESFGGLDDTLVPIDVPLGDLQDVVAIDAERALAGDSRGLADLAANYDGVGTVVADAQVSGNPWVGGAGMVIAVKSYGEPLGQPFSITLAQTQDEKPEAFFERGVIAVGQGLEAAWKSANAIQFTEASSLRVRALAQALQDWLLIRKNLEMEPLVSNLKVISLRRGEVILDMSHRGSTEQLQRALAQRGLTLVQAAGGWDLQLGGAPGGIQARPLPVPQNPAPAPSGGGSSAE